MEQIKTKSARQELKDMEVNEIIEFPIQRMCSVRSACSAYGLEWGRRFSTAVDREKSVIAVTRKL